VIGNAGESRGTSEPGMTRSGAREPRADRAVPSFGFNRPPNHNTDAFRRPDPYNAHHVFERLLEIVQPDFQPTTWEAFRRFAPDGLPAAQAAAELDLNENAVLQAKARILKR
jgi:hypothetical protein